MGRKMHTMPRVALKSGVHRKTLKSFFAPYPVAPPPPTTNGPSWVTAKAQQRGGLPGPQHLSLQLKVLPELDVEPSELLGLALGQEVVSVYNQVDPPILMSEAAGARCPLDETEAL